MTLYFSCHGDGINETVKFRLISLTAQVYVNLPKTCCHKELFQFHAVHGHV